MRKEIDVRSEADERSERDEIQEPEDRARRRMREIEVIEFAGERRGDHQREATGDHLRRRAIQS